MNDANAQEAREREEQFDGPWWRHPPLRNAVIAGLIAGVGFVVAHVFGLPQQFENLFHWLAIPIGAYHWAREGIEELIEEREVGIEILMLAATIGAGALRLWDEAAALVVLYGAAEGVEEYTYARTRHAIRSLLDLAPKQARVLHSGEEVCVSAESLSPGDVFVVRPGESVATDGVICAGSSSLDESTVTGESVPVDKGPGDQVFAASINRQGALEVEATAAFADNTLSKIIHLVEEAQERKGRAQQWIERFGRWYSPAVLLVAVLLLLAPFIGGGSLSEWARRAVVLLVAAAPCALVMSTPVAMASAVGRAGRRGILVKGGVHLEHLGAIRVVAFDKTGTLTQGKAVVVDVVAVTGSVEQLIAVAAGVEWWSEHPIARAIVEHARACGVVPLKTEQFEALMGAGARARHGAATWYVGKPALLSGMGVDLRPVEASLEYLQRRGDTVVVVGDGTAAMGVIALQDPPRPGAKDVVARLAALGMHVAMLTGDSVPSAHAQAAKLAITDARGGLRPEDKVAAVESLAKLHGPVLMVGDGVNDAPALAAAACGIAMGAAGADAAIEAADVALMGDDLGKVEEAIRLGRQVRRISAQNIAFSLVVLATLIPLAVTGMMSVTVAVVVHEASELLAVANGLRAGSL